jgi:predicted CXXCH cytochrome family protein
MSRGYEWKILFAIAAIASLLLADKAYPQDKFRLKPGGEINLCIECHADFREKLKRPFVHTPVKGGKCSECHNPHTSSHGKLLASESRRICFSCHGALIPKNAVSSHKVVVEGNCTKCHDPHGGNNKYSLSKTANQLCLDCHKNIGGASGKIKFKHDPVEKGCVNCHNPHASSKNEFLLKEGVPNLCLKCHRTNTAVFAKQHVNYPVGTAKCTVCHDVHGSNKGGILFDTTHRPVANKMCNQCHFEPTSSNPFQTKKGGFELCRGCHNTLMNDIFNKNRIHWPLMDKDGCLNCHNPHASSQKGLINNSMLKLCGKCHSDTIARQEGSATKHSPVMNGECMACHTPHASNDTLLFNKSSVIEICGTCHEWQKHSSHPIGEKFVDPRNKNLRLQCLSCHRTHGTEHKNMLTFATITTLCTQCHEQFKR